MKFLLILAALVCASGCSSAGNLKKFLDKLPATDIDGAEHHFTSPLWSDDIVVKDISTDSDGLLDVKSASAKWRVPLWGVESTTTLTDFKQIPTEKERAQAAAVAAANKAARADAAAAKAKVKAIAAAEAAAKVKP